MASVDVRTVAGKVVRKRELPDDLFGALLATVPPREDRGLAAPLFAGLTDARLRMAITRACRATGTPHFSPHGLRRRRGSQDLLGWLDGVHWGSGHSR